MKYFDTHLIASSESPAPPPETLCGGVLFGPHAELHRAALQHGRWYCVQLLKHLVGPEDSRNSDLIDLQLSEAELLAHLRRAGSGGANNPSPHWWPLLNAAATQKRIVRIGTPPGTAAAKGVRVLARQFPRTRFLLDVFRHGSVSGWQAQVRLAECENVWITTLGMFPSPLCRWEVPHDLEEAMHFVSGEVGAGKLLFASGLEWESLVSKTALSPPEWLAQIHTLDDAQRELVLFQNAREIFE